MATHKEVTEREDFARRLLEHQIKPVSICTMLQARYGVSRSTAYDDIHKAKAVVDASDDGPAVEDTALDVASLQGQLVYLLSRKVIEEDIKSVSQCVKALDTVNKWNGMQSTLQGSHKTGYCN